MNQPGPADYGLLILLSAIFGAAFLLIEVSIETVPVLTVVASRLGLAAIVFYCFARWAGQQLPSLGRHWGLLVATALFGNTLPFFLITWGQQEVDAGLASILVSVMPFFTILLAHFFTHDEKLNFYKVAGMLLGLCGIIYLFGVEKLGSLGSDVIHQYALLGAAACYAINVIIMKRLTEYPRHALIAAILAVSFAIILPVTLLLDAPFEISPSARSLIAIVVLAVFASAGGNILRFALIERQGVSFLSQINYLIPIMAVGMAWLFLGHVPTTRTYIALVLVFAGIAIVRLGNLRSGASTNVGGSLRGPRL